MSDLPSSSLSKSPGDEEIVKDRSSGQRNPGEIARSHLPRSLSLLFSVLPRDLVFEVFGWLTPRELIKLVEVNRELRQLLMSQGSKSIWKSARERNWTLIPDSPSDMTELEWARLIFSTTCKRCRCGSRTIIWEARIRLCRSCWSLLSISAMEYMYRLPGFWPSTRLSAIEPANTASAVNSGETVRNLSHVGPSDLVPFSLAWSESGGQINTARFYLPDFQKAKQKVTDYRLKIASQFPGAEEEFATYISNCEARNMEIQRHTILCENNYPHLMSVEFAEQQAGRDRLHRYLLDIGHREEDVKMALESPGIDFTLGLTLAAFIANQERLEHAVRAMKAKNVQAERRELARSIYPELCAVSGLERHHFAPFPEDFLHWSLASNIIHQDPDVVITKKDFLDLKSNFMDFVDAWRSSQSLTIRKRVAGDVPNSLAEDPKGAMLLRATSVFRCGLHYKPDKACLVWIDGSFLQHMSDSTGNLYFERRMCLERWQLDSQVVASLVRATGRDPDTTSVDQMDVENPRFYCRDCFLGSKISRTWRRSVIHYAEHHFFKKFRGWERLDAQETQWSIDREFFPWPSQPYSCLHCNSFEQEQRARSWRDLLSHLRESHSCDAPVRRVDYLVDLTAHPRPVNMEDSRIMDYSLDRTLLCQHCVDNRVKSKAFDRKGLASHAKAVHSIRTVRPSDYIEVS